ncbi:hypothetical protein ABMA28_010100 [Loxostege sticticalis]|uniref:Peptidase S1 domain-containing protein n=1 Tax=Loxostege sticticalis TaxID=481309 RepID=A0ABD0S9P8_LOXSC
MLLPVLLFLQAQYWVGEAGVALSKNAKIIGGHDIDITEAPYTVAIFRKGHPVCWGALIDKNIVLTAGSCFRKTDKARFFKVRTGSTYIGEGGEYHNVSRYVAHPRIHKRRPDNDIAVMFLTKPVTFSDKAAAIPMKEKDDEISVGEVTQVTGWGVSDGPKVFKHNFKLQSVSVQTVNESVCAKQIKHKITPRMMCASALEGFKGFCSTDYGAPLVHNGKLAGLASWFNVFEPHIWRYCPNDEDVNQVYAKVSGLRTWIDETIKEQTTYNNA